MIGSTIDIIISILLIIGGIVIGVIFFWLYQDGKDSRAGTQLEANSKKSNASNVPQKVDYPREDVQKFMEFDKIEDDMIIQEKGNRFVMAIKCQGINYDLTSENEMLAVEEGFSNFLNTLKYPIQLYVQARSLNLEESINTYKDRIMSLRDEYIRTENSTGAAKRSGNLTSQQRQALDFELKKKRVLLEYGTDIVNYVEKMSLNRNILQRKYYIVVSYHTSELGMATNFTKEEAHDLAYSELYTRCRSIAGALAPCGVQTSIMNSMELAEMLYVAYNRDESDIYNIRKAVDNGFYRLYSTAQDVLEKKQIAIDNAVKEKAIEEAETALKNAMNRLKDKNGLTYEEQQEDSAKAQAMQLIIENSDQFDQDVVDDALIDLNSQMHVPVMDEDEVNVLSERETSTVDQVVNSINSSTEEKSKVDNVNVGNTENTKYHNDDTVKGTVILGDDKISTKQKDAISDIDGLVNNSSNNDDSLV